MGYFHSLFQQKSEFPIIEQKNNNVFRGIGVSNVHERIQLEYGADYGLHYESDEKSFTDAFITFPKITTLSDVSTPL